MRSAPVRAATADPGHSPHTPERTCVGCRTRRPADQLDRVARRADGSLTFGRTLPGRGAWLCRGSLECLERAVRTNGFGRAFRTAVPREATGTLRADMLALRDGGFDGRV